MDKSPTKKGFGESIQDLWATIREISKMRLKKPNPDIVVGTADGFTRTATGDFGQIRPAAFDRWEISALMFHEYWAVMCEYGPEPVRLSVEQVWEVWFDHYYIATTVLLSGDIPAAVDEILDGTTAAEKGEWRRILIAHFTLIHEIIVFPKRNKPVTELNELTVREKIGQLRQKRVAFFDLLKCAAPEAFRYFHDPEAVVVALKPDLNGRRSKPITEPDLVVLLHLLNRFLDFAVAWKAPERVDLGGDDLSTLTDNGTDEWFPDGIAEYLCFSMNNSVFQHSHISYYFGHLFRHRLHSLP